MLIQQIVDLCEVLAGVLGRHVAGLAQTSKHVWTYMELVERDCNLCSIHILVLLDVIQTDALDVINRYWLRGNIQLGRSTSILGADLSVLKINYGKVFTYCHILWLIGEEELGNCIFLMIFDHLDAKLFKP